MRKYLDIKPDGGESPIFLISCAIIEGRKKEAMVIADYMRGMERDVPPLDQVRLMPFRDSEINKRLIMHLKEVGF